MDNNWTEIDGVRIYYTLPTYEKLKNMFFGKRNNIFYSKLLKQVIHVYLN